MSAASGGNSEPKQGQRSQSARGFCPRSTMRVPQPDIIEHFGNADAVPQPPERCLSLQAGIVRCCPNISFIKKTNSVAPSLYSSFFFPLLFLFLSTNIFLFASQFYGNSFVDFGTCCYTYNSSIVAVAKSSIAAIVFSPISKRFICLFFLLPHKAASHTGDFYRTFFQELLSRAACLPASLELSRDFYRENFGVVKSIYSTLSSFFFTFCFIIGWFLATFSLPLPFPPSSRSVQHFFGHFFRDF